jgi:hypothetical protein
VYFNRNHTFDIAAKCFGRLFALHKCSVKISHAWGDVTGTKPTAKR